MAAATGVAATTALAGSARAAGGGRVLVVAVNGSDAASGDLAHPMATVDAAVRRLPASGGTVELRGGVYHQRVTLAGRHGITIAPHAHELAQLSGAGLTPGPGFSALVDISDSSQITISGLDVTAYRTAALDHTPVGIYVHGHDSGVDVVGNHVHDLGNDNTTLGSFDFGAHGIAAYGDDPDASISGLVIADNTVDHLTLGASESVVVNGNVDGWAITGNAVHDDNNIGIDAIGFEPTLSGSHRYTEANRARHGTIADNRVSMIRSQGNPSYYEDGSWCDCADGIYVDGGTHIAIDHNQVVSNDIGIEVAAENGKGDADFVTVSHNTISGSLYTGIATGGYCNDTEACGGVQTGSSHDNVFTHNTLTGNNQLDDGSPELLVQYYTYRDTFTHNTITATNSAHAVYGTQPGAAPVPGQAGNTSDDNTFAATGAGPEQLRFAWLGRTYVGATAYRAATHQDAHSTFR